MQSWKSHISDTALRQGPSFVILLLILYGLWDFTSYVIHVGLPQHFQEIQSGYEEIQKSHDRNLDRLIDADEKGDELMREAITEMRLTTKHLCEHFPPR